MSRLTRDGAKLSGANGDKLTTSRIDNVTRLIHIRLYVPTIHLYINVVVVVVVVVSHIQRIGCQPGKTTSRGGQSRSWSAEQEKRKEKILAAFLCATLSQCSCTGLSQGHGCTWSSDGLVSYAVSR